MRYTVIPKPSSTGNLLVAQVSVVGISFFLKHIKAK